MRDSYSEEFDGTSSSSLTNIKTSLIINMLSLGLFVFVIFSADGFVRSIFAAFTCFMFCIFILNAIDYAILKLKEF